MDYVESLKDPCNLHKSKEVSRTGTWEEAFQEMRCSSHHPKSNPTPEALPTVLRWYLIATAPESLLMKIFRIEGEIADLQCCFE